MAKTLFDKVWDAHVVKKYDDGSELLFIDRHLIHEVTSPQAFEGLRLKGRTIRHPERTLAVEDHDVPTIDTGYFSDPIARVQISQLRKNCEEFGVEIFSMGNENQGIVHVVGPEQGFTLPGATIVCGDSHTATHGAFGALAFGIGTSEIEHVFATQCLVQTKKPGSYLILLEGKLPLGVGPKDIIMRIIREIGTAGGTGYVFEYAGEAIRDLNMEERMTICNMSIEGGARAGMIAPDETTFRFFNEIKRPKAPQGEELQEAIAYWKTLASDEGAVYDKTLVIDVSTLVPQVSWGNNPAMVADVTDVVPAPEEHAHSSSENVQRALDYMGLTAGTKIVDIPIDWVFIGSCTNSRMGDLRQVAKIVAGKKVHPSVVALIVPGSARVKRQAEAEGLDQIFLDAGFEWREPGCSMCLGMNPDKVPAGKHCASTSNRNFEGRQGKGARTHLCSPIMAAAAALEGHFVDIRQWHGFIS